MRPPATQKRHRSVDSLNPCRTPPPGKQAPLRLKYQFVHKTARLHLLPRHIYLGNGILHHPSPALAPAGRVSQVIQIKNQTIPDH